MKNIPQSARQFKEKVTPLLIFFITREGRFEVDFEGSVCKGW